MLFIKLHLVLWYVNVCIGAFMDTNQPLIVGCNDLVYSFSGTFLLIYFWNSSDHIFNFLYAYSSMCRSGETNLVRDITEKKIVYIWKRTSAGWSFLISMLWVLTSIFQMHLKSHHFCYFNAHAHISLLIKMLRPKFHLMNGLK